PFVSPMLPVVSPVYVPLPGMSFGDRQFCCLSTQSGLLAQSGSAQSILPSWSSSLPLSHTSGVGAELGEKAQDGSAQSILPSQLLSLPSSQTSLVHIWHGGENRQSGSAQSTSVSQSLSMPSPHTSGEPGGGHLHADVPAQSGSAQSM